MKDNWSSDGKSIKFQLIEGEYFVDMWQENGHLFVKTNLDRVYKSTSVPVENMDFIELTQ